MRSGFENLQKLAVFTDVTILSMVLSMGRLCTKNTSWALIERPYSCAPQAVGAVYDRPGFFVQSPTGRFPHASFSVGPIPLLAEEGRMRRQPAGWRRRRGRAKREPDRAK